MLVRLTIKAALALSFLLLTLHSFAYAQVATYSGNDMYIVHRHASGKMIIGPAGSGDLELIVSQSGSAVVALSANGSSGALTAAVSLTVPDITVSDDLSVTDDLTVGDDITLGTSSVINGTTSILVGIGGTNQVSLTDGALLPVTDDDVDLGSASAEFQDAFFDGTVTADAISSSGSVTITGSSAHADIQNGSVLFRASGRTIFLEDDTASSSCLGTATLNGTSAVTVSTTCITAGDKVFLTRTSETSATGNAFVSNIVNGVSFDIDSDTASDDSTVNWFIVKQL